MSIQFSRTVNGADQSVPIKDYKLTSGTAVIGTLVTLDANTSGENSVTPATYTSNLYEGNAFGIIVGSNPNFRDKDFTKTGTTYVKVLPISHNYLFEVDKKSGTSGQAIGTTYKIDNTTSDSDLRLTATAVASGKTGLTVVGIRDNGNYDVVFTNPQIIT
jgi:hypothetical protein